VTAVERAKPRAGGRLRSGCASAADRRNRSGSPLPGRAFARSVRA